jgi:hypothetical protein
VWRENSTLAFAKPTWSFYWNAVWLWKLFDLVRAAFSPATIPLNCLPDVFKEFTKGRYGRIASNSTLPWRDISLELRLSEHTVRNYLFRIFNKLGVSARLELAVYAIHQRDTGPYPSPND